MSEYYQVVKWESTKNFYIRLAGMYFAGFDGPGFAQETSTKWGREADAKPFDSEIAARAQIELLQRSRTHGDDSSLLELIAGWEDLYPSHRGDTEEALILSRLAYKKCEEDNGISYP